MKKPLIFAILLPLAMFAQDVPLVENTMHGITGTFAGSIAHGDVNNDGNEDIFLAGFTFNDLLGTPTSFTSLTQLLLGDGNGGFTVVPTPFPNLGSSYVALKDINGDGNLDAYVSGLNDNSELFAATYLGDGNGGFGTEPHQILTGLQFTSATFGDLDGDGDDDMIATGMDADDVARSIVYRNDNGFFTEIATVLDNVLNASVAIFDIDNDGPNDVIIIGDNGNNLISKMYKNNGNFVFSVLPNPFSPSTNVSMDVADINGDGYMDIALMGTTMSASTLVTYLNNQDGTFSLFETFGPGASYGQVVFGDMNNDGSIDGFFVGSEDGFNRARMYLNNGTGQMILERSFSPGYMYASATLVDINNDGYLDIIYNGTNSTVNSNGKIRVWMSHIPVPCEVPVNLVISNIDENSADVSWNAGGDESQWQVLYGLTGFDPNTSGTTVLSGTTSVTITNLLPNTGYDVYVRSVCGIDGNSNWTELVSFTTDEIVVICEVPTSLGVTNITETTADVSWNAGGNEPQWQVSYGITGFDPNTGGTTVLSGTTSITITNLLPNTGYDVYVRAVCGTEDYSDWAELLSFTTNTVSVGDHYFVNFTYYPNPVRDILNLKAGLLIEEVQVFNMLGRMVINVQPNSMETIISTPVLSPGIYMMKVSIKGNQKIFRVVKK